MFRYLITNGLDGMQWYLVSLALSLPIILFSLTIHECAHGWMAMKLGDRTAYNLGRLTLNPIKHIDPIGFICMLAITMVAAPGVPGGAIMASLGLLQSMLGFNQEAQALMIALYIAMDSFGTACNVTGDGAIAIIVDRFTRTK